MEVKAGEEAPPPRRRDFRDVRGMDPAANWLLGDGEEDYLPDAATTLIPLLFEPIDDKAARAFDSLERRNEAIIISFSRENDLVRAGKLVAMFVTRDWLESLFDGSRASKDFLEAEKRIVLSSPLEIPEEGPGPGPFKAEPRPRYDLAPDTSEEIVVAAIDDGFAFAHERFQVKEGEPRVEAFWNMNLGFPLPLPQPPTPLPGELTKAQIKAAIAASKATVGVVDEDVVYHNEGLLNFGGPRHKPLAWRVSHGTHILDLAGGSDPGDGGPPLVAVQLPTPVVARTTGELLDFYVWVGVDYILSRAEARPVVINISFGYDAGPHDGQGLLEKHLSLLAEEPNRIRLAVLPAGNAQLSRCHATVHPKKSAPVELEWIVQPEDRTHSIVEVWLPDRKNTGERIKLTVVLPDGTKFAVSEPVFPFVGVLPKRRLSHAGRRMGLVELCERQDGRRMFRIAIAPTARAQPDQRALAPSGRWTLRFEAGRKPLKEPAHAWVQRDDSLYGYPQRGRQSYFDHEGYVRFDDAGYEMDADPAPSVPPCPVTRTSLLNAIATSPRVVVAGGYRSRDCRIARYSSGGPNTPANSDPLPRKKPDVLLPSDGSPAHPGVLAAGARSGGRVAMDGTSVASPQLARYIASWLTTAADPGRPKVKAAAQKSPAVCQRPPSSDRDGHGRLDRLDPLSVERFEQGP